jgi:hypothetical protein
LNSVPDAWSEDRKSFRLVVPDIERGMNHARRNKDRVACAEDSLLRVEPLLDLAAENKHHLFLIWMIVEALPFAGEYDAFQDGEALGPGLGGAAHPPKLAPIGGSMLMERSNMNVPPTVAPRKEFDSGPRSQVSK